MIINWSNTITIKEIQQLFSAQFPFLHLAFFYQPYDIRTSSSHWQMIPASQIIASICSPTSSTAIEISQDQTAGTVQLAFFQQWGLHVHVCWLYHQQWYHTTGNNNLTLKELNEVSEDIANKPEAANKVDNFLDQEY